VNDDQKSVLFNKIMTHFKGEIKGKNFAFWGLSFKPNTDDMREAPSIVLVRKLLAEGASVTGYDPVAMEEAHRDLKDTITYAKTAYDAVKNADALCLITEWSEFRIPEWNKVAESLTNKVVFDGRNLYDAERMRERGFDYYGIGVK
jgi:UDPglucose 6-dehydrogenase